MRIMLSLLLIKLSKRLSIMLKKNLKEIYLRKLNLQLEDLNLIISKKTLQVFINFGSYFKEKNHNSNPWHSTAM